MHRIQQLTALRVSAIHAVNMSVPRSDCHEWHGTLHIYITIMMNRDMSILITQLTFYIHRSGMLVTRLLKTRSTSSRPNISAQRTYFIAKINHNIHPSVSSMNLQYFRFRNCKLAFETADLRLGITPLLDVCDVVGVCVDFWRVSCRWCEGLKGHRACTIRVRDFTFWNVKLVKSYIICRCRWGKYTI